MSPDEVPAKLNELCKLCGSSGLIPESMKLRDDGNDPLEATKYMYPSPILLSEFKGRKVAVKIVRLHVSQRLEEPLRVSTPKNKLDSQAMIHLAICDVEVLQRSSRLETPSTSKHPPAPRCDTT
jgi:hypothetical protein